MQCQGCGKDFTATTNARPSHRLLCGDSRDAGDVARLLGGAQANVAFTSPPYAQQRAYDEQSEFRPVPPGEYLDWFEAVQENVRTHLAEDGSWFLNIKAHSKGGQRQLYVMDLILAHVRRWGWRFVDDLCWVRSGVPGAWSNRFKNGWEPVFHFCRQAEIKFRPEAVSQESDDAFDYSPANGHSVSGSSLLGKEHATRCKKGMARPSNVIHVSSGGRRVSGEHPAEFPVGLPRWFLLAFSDPGDVVYDPFVGSGSSMVAAEETGRVCCGMEISPEYIAVILERLSGLGLHPHLEENAAEEKR